MLENIVKVNSKPANAALKWPMPHSDGTALQLAERERGVDAPIVKKDGDLPNREGYASDTVGFYFSCIRKYAMITAREEMELARKVAKGDDAARRRMIEANLRLVVNIARRYVNRGLPIQDLIEEGNIGLIKAVERFKASKGCRFSTYATYWIKQSVERGLANHANTVRLPIHISADIACVGRATRELTAHLKREPGTAEISERTGLSGRYIKKLALLGKKNCSLDSCLSDGSEPPLMERLVDDSQPAPMELLEWKRRAARVDGWLKKLDGNEKAVIMSRFGFDKGGGKTLEEIGKDFGVTRERIRQIELIALKNLKNMIERTGFTASDFL